MMFFESRRKRLMNRAEILMAECDCIKLVFDGADEISSYYIDQVIQKRGELASIKFKLKEMSE